MPVLNSSKALLLGVSLLALVGSVAAVVSPSADAASKHSLFSNTDSGRARSDVHNNPVELGLQIRPSVDGQVTAVKFLKSEEDEATSHTVNVWSSKGQLLGSGKSNKESEHGWQRVNLPRPVLLNAGSTYVISYHTEKYAVTNEYFKTDITKGPLTVLGSRNSTYKYGSTSAFPTDTYKNSNYWVDLVFAATTKR